MKEACRLVNKLFGAGWCAELCRRLGDAGERVLGLEMVRGANGDRVLREAFIQDLRAEAASLGRCRWRALRWDCPCVSAFLCVSLTAQGSQPSLGVFTGTKLGVLGQGWSQWPPGPRFRERRQRPKPRLDTGLGLCTG